MTNDEPIRLCSGLAARMTNAQSEQKTELKSQLLRYALMKSARDIPDCEQIVRKVDAFSVT